MTARKIRNKQLMIGAAQVDITPVEGTQIAGGVGVFRPATLVMDPLYAKALIIKSGNRKLCLITLDVTIVTEKYTSEIRTLVARKFGFEKDAVLVHALQDHSAPTLGSFMLSDDFKLPKKFEWLRGGDPKYNEITVKKIINAVKTANESLQPAKMSLGSGMEGRVAFNRRGVTRDGKMRMPWLWDSRNNPLGPPEFCYLEGPADPEVGVICFRTESLSIPAVLVNYTCHPVCVFCIDPSVGTVSADWPGALSDALKKKYCIEGIPMVINGACGNINPWNPFEPGHKNGTDHIWMGGTLAEMAGKIIEKSSFKEINHIDWKVKHLNIPLRKIPEKLLKTARKILKKNPTPKLIEDDKKYVDREWFQSAMIEDLYQRQRKCPMFDYEIQIFRIGDAAIVGLPGEPFVEGQLKIKMGSPTRHTHVVHCVNHYTGYIPIKEAFQRGGHEADISSWSKLAPDALDMIVDASIDMLNELF